jgi:hypothetical protein
MSIYPTEHDHLSEERHYERLDAKIERAEDRRIEEKLKEEDLWDLVFKIIGAYAPAFEPEKRILQSRFEIKKRETETDF